MDKDWDSLFQAIMKDSDIDDCSPVSIEELTVIMSSLSACAMHVSQMLIEGMEADDEDSLNISDKTATMLRTMYEHCERFVDTAIAEMFGDDPDDEEDDEDDNNNGF